MVSVIDHADQLPADFSVGRLPKLPFPRRVLMCPPDAFDVVDVKNPFMAGNQGSVDRALAAEQWRELKAAFEAIGLGVELISPLPDAEDMVFTANQTFVGLDGKGMKICVLAQMRHPSRRREVPPFGEWFAARDYEVFPLGESSVFFEGGGDAIWHPGRALIWGGVGPRTGAGAYPPLARRFEVPVLRLELSEPFYHLDTCFCPLDESTVMLHPGAFSETGLALVRRVFSRIIEVDAEEAHRCMACNAAAFLGTHVVIQRGAARTVAALRSHGYHVVEVETGEFMKSGGSVFCMKLGLF